jgi:ribose 5-phosphate isomerase B
MKKETNLVIHVATDHAGFVAKEEIRLWLESEGFKVVDHGARQFDGSDDFPDFIVLAARAVSESPNQTRAIIFGGSGQGEAMMANRLKNVRAVVCYRFDSEIIRLSRTHNDSNVLSFGARFVLVEEMKQAIEIWLSTPVENDPKRARRNQKIELLSRHNL